MEPTPVVTHLVDLALQILAPLVVVLAGYLANRLVKVLEAKTGVDIPEKQEAMLDTYIQDGIRYAEEKAHQAAKRADAKLTGHEKLEAATSFVLHYVEKNGWVEWTRDRLKAKIDAKINVMKKRPGSPAGK